MQQKQAYNPALSGNPISPLAYPNGNPGLPYNRPGARNTDSCVPMRYGEEVTHNYACDGPAPGDIYFKWIYGSSIAALNRDPRIQALQYNEDTYILRQNICVHWEGPFTYLLFGNRGALLIDAGATQEASYYPLRRTVDAIIHRWSQMRGKKSVPLTIALTSGEDIAQNQGLIQFADRPDTKIAPQPLAEMKRFYGFAASWPEGIAQIDLGDRIVDVIPTPGTHKDGLTFYDRYNDFLHTGDFLFPGKINIANDRDYAVSLARLKKWKDEHSVKWVMGGHVEMQFVPGKVYPRFYTYKPYEHLLQMEPALIDEALTYAQQVQGQKLVLIRPEFVLLNRVGPDQRTPVFPEGVPNITAPRPF
jgi:glyoxylase-like metal-dependent hydrolase (beta-lactamase superfamily II)